MNMDDPFNDLTLGSQEFNSQCVFLASQIKNGDKNVLNLVESLQPYLTNNSREQRIKGITILFSILKDLSNVDAQQVDIVANFLCERLKDHHEVVPSVLKGLVIIVNFDNLSEGISKKILSSIFEHVPCQQQQQPDRYNIYCIFKKLYETHKNELKEMGLDLIYGIITAIDGERDPRNLTFLFNWLEEFLKDFELGHLSEEFFEVLACYFPVDFRPSSEDGITRDSLACSLTKCLCSPKLGDFIIPLALEKLDSDLETAKLDSLDVLTLSSQRYPPTLLTKYSTAIWPSLHKEILSSQNKIIEKRALETISSFVKCVTNQNIDPTITSLLQSMVYNVKGNSTPDSKLFEPSYKIILATASSKISSEYIVETMIPLWINVFKLSSTEQYQKDILNVLCELSVIVIKTGLNFENKFMENIPELFLEVLIKNNHPISLKWDVLKYLQKIAGYLPKNSREILFENFKILLRLENNYKSNLMDCFKKYAEFYPEEIKDLIISLKEGEVKIYLDVLGSVLHIKKLWSVFLDELCTFTLENQKEITKIGLSTFKKALEREKDEKMEKDFYEFENYLYKNQNFPVKLTNWFLNHLKDINLNLEMDLMNDLWIILYKIISKLNIEDQSKVLNEIFELIKSNPIEEVVIIYFGVLIGLKNFQMIDFNLWRGFIKTAFETESNYINEILSRLIGNLINKLNDEGIFNQIQSEIENEIINCKKGINCINVLSYFTKGLVMKMDKNATIWINKLLEISHKMDQNQNGYKSVEIILNESLQGFDKFCYVNERLLYKQKFFLHVIKYLEENSTSKDTNYLAIAACLVLGVPETLLYMHLKAVIKWIILYLDSSTDNLTILNLCQLINRSLKNKTGDIFQFKNEILKVYLKLATTNPSMKIRMEVLKGLRLFTEFPLHEIINQRQDVINTLNICVDDRKRLVRKEAMETRLKWYLIDSPT